MTALLSFVICHSSFAFVYENAWELQADGDFNGDGRRDVLIVDKATGAFRLGYQQPSTELNWFGPRASGIAPASGLGIGKLNSLAFDSIALTGPAANRINVLDATNPAVATLPVSHYPPSLGPNMAVAMDVGGSGNNTFDDIYAASLYNGATPFRETLIRTVGTTNRTNLANNVIPYQREHGNPILLHTNRSARLGLFQRNYLAGIDAFTLCDLTSGAASQVASVLTFRTPQPYEFLSGQFNIGNPYTQVLLYPPTGYYFYVYQVLEPVPGTYSLAYSNTYVLPNYIDRMFVLPGTNGSRLLVLDTNGTSAAIFSFNGIAAPTVLQNFNAAPGEHFTGAGVLGTGGFVAYSAPIGQNTSSRFSQWMWNGSAYTNSASGDLPTGSPYSAAGNVMQFRHEPFVTNNPILLRLNNAGDWSSAPMFSGVPGNISVRTESFLNSTQGLVNPTLLTLGPAHPLAQFGLANQYSNMISLFSFTPPAGDKISDVTISPLPGQYVAAIELKFAAANPTDSIFFRVSNGPWITWNAGLVFKLFTNTTVQYYGQPSGGGTKSAIKSAVYSFTEGPSTLDSDADGVPDYVEIARGLDPNGGSDSDGDGYSDLEELIHGKDPNSTSSVPTNFPHLDDQAALDLHVRPRPWDGFSNVVSLCATGAILRAYDFQGSLMSYGLVASNSWPIARLTNISLVAEKPLISFATELHYNILTTNADKTVGRELVGIVASPPLMLPQIPYSYSGGTLATEAQNWINAASNTLNNLPRARLTNELAVTSTLESLLVERKIAQLLGLRGNTWWTNMTLFPFRVSDAGRTNPPQALLLSLQQATNSLPGHKLQTIFKTVSNLVQTSASANVANLRAVVRDIYRINSLLNNTNPATFVSPVDETRHFLWNGTFHSNYLFWATTSGLFGSATAGAATILNAVPPRPTTNVSLVVRADTLGNACRILDLNGGVATFSLMNSAGLPFSFPDNFELLPGAIVQVAGYTDVTNPACAYQAIEVTSALLNSVPLATDADEDGNLLIDSWEKKFYGYVSLTDPFDDSDGDGYTDLQEMLEGSDPRDIFGIPAVGPVAFVQPALMLSSGSGMIELHFHWPPAYINEFNFGVRHTSNLGDPFTDLAVSAPTFLGGDEFMITFTAPPSATHYYYLTISLK